MALKNKLGIESSTELAREEERVTRLKLNSLSPMNFSIFGRDLSCNVVHYCTNSHPNLSKIHLARGA